MYELLNHSGKALNDSPSSCFYKCLYNSSASTIQKEEITLQMAPWPDMELGSHCCIAKLSPQLEGASRCSVCPRWGDLSPLSAHTALGSGIPLPSVLRGLAAVPCSTCRMNSSRPERELRAVAKSLVSVVSSVV